MSLVHYIFVRRDLPLGIMAAMVTHAAGESSVKTLPIFWGGTAVVLGVDNEEELEDALIYLEKKKIKYVSITESDEPYSGQLMAIGVVPDSRDTFGNVFKKFKLLTSLIEPKPLQLSNGCLKSEPLVEFRDDYPESNRNDLTIQFCGQNSLDKLSKSGV